MIGTMKMTDTAREIARYVAARMNLSDRGATAVEYGMIVALIAAVIVVTVGFLGGDTHDGFKLVEENIDGKAQG